MARRDIKLQTEYAIRDLHARESMRVGWYRHLPGGEPVRLLRAQKARHQALLNDLLRRRSLRPIWYASLFFWIGHILGLVSAWLPARFSRWIERTLEEWILFRYQRYRRRLRLYFDVRSMVEAIQLNKLAHNEPGPDVLHLIDDFIRNEEFLLSERTDTALS